VSDETPETPQPPATRDRWWLIAGVAIVALAVGAGIALLVTQDDGGGNVAAGATTTVATGAVTPQQIATAQKALADVGCYTGPIDGIYGPVTDAAIRSFQQAKGLTVDGVVGPQTLAALQQAQAAGKPVCTAATTTSAPAPTSTTGTSAPSTSTSTTSTSTSTTSTSTSTTAKP
jgi:peptidoglycan hydrolase-like protein with peptidoglycan-binding domain